MKIVPTEYYQSTGFFGIFKRFLYTNREIGSSIYSFNAKSQYNISLHLKPQKEFIDAVCIYFVRQMFSMVDSRYYRSIQVRYSNLVKGKDPEMVYGKQLSILIRSYIKIICDLGAQGGSELEAHLGGLHLPKLLVWIAQAIRSLSLIVTLPMSNVTLKLGVEYLASGDGLMDDISSVCFQINEFGKVARLANGGGKSAIVVTNHTMTRRAPGTLCSFVKSNGKSTTVTVCTDYNAYAHDVFFNLILGLHFREDDIHSEIMDYRECEIDLLDVRFYKDAAMFLYNSLLGEFQDFRSGSDSSQKVTERAGDVSMNWYDGAYSAEDNISGSSS